MSLSAVSSSASGARGLLWDGLIASLRENSPLILFVLIYGLAPIARLQPGRDPGRAVPRYPDVLCRVLRGGGGVRFRGLRALVSLQFARPQGEELPGGGVAAHPHDFLRRERLLLALPVLALWPITASGFTYLKSVIPLVHPFYLDPALAEWDRTLHFGDRSLALPAAAAGLRADHLSDRLRLHAVVPDPAGDPGAAGRRPAATASGACSSC